MEHKNTKLYNTFKHYIKEIFIKARLMWRVIPGVCVFCAGAGIV